MSQIAAIQRSSMALKHPKQLGNEFCKWLTILYYVVASINLLVGEDFSSTTPDSAKAVADDDLQYMVPPFFINSGLALIAGPKADNLRELRLQIGRTLVKLGLFCREFRESDVETVHALTKCLQKWATQFGGGIKSDMLPSTEKVQKNLIT